MSRQGLYDYLERRDRPWKYAALAREMRAILKEYKENDTYDRKQMYEALTWDADGSIPSERTVYRIMKKLGISHRTRKKRTSSLKRTVQLENPKT